MFLTTESSQSSDVAFLKASLYMQWEWKEEDLSDSQACQYHVPLFLDSPTLISSDVHQPKSWHKSTSTAIKGQVAYKEVTKNLSQAIWSSLLSMQGALE